ncbi:MAG: CPBP family intramembrane metalloprotease [Lachnospiraceae bacterium]|nr:CPBP family intramembrane metalloprotease [Lachnospiraceae bacterium]
MEKWSERHPYRISILTALLMTLIVVAGNVVSNVMGLDAYIKGAGYYLAVSVANLINITIAVVIMHKSGRSFQNYGFRRLEKDSFAKVWFLLPGIIEAVLPVVLVDVVSDMTASLAVVLVFFTITIAFTEEMFFRGLILKYIEKEGVKRSVLVSSIIFGAMHLANTLGGNSIPSTILQVFFAFLFGVVCAEVVYLTKSLWLPIIWHMTHDFISYITEESFTLGSLSEETSILLLGAVQFILLIIYAVSLWNKLSRETERTTGKTSKNMIRQA